MTDQQKYVADQQKSLQEVVATLENQVSTLREELRDIEAFTEPFFESLQTAWQRIVDLEFALAHEQRMNDQYWERLKQSYEMLMEARGEGAKDEKQ